MLRGKWHILFLLTWSTILALSLCLFVCVYVCYHTVSSTKEKIKRGWELLKSLTIWMYQYSFHLYLPQGNEPVQMLWELTSHSVWNHKSLTCYQSSLEVRLQKQFKHLSRDAGQLLLHSFKLLSLTVQHPKACYALGWVLCSSNTLQKDFWARCIEKTRETQQTKLTKQGSQRLNQQSQSLLGSELGLLLICYGCTTWGFCVPTNSGSRWGCFWLFCLLLGPFSSHWFALTSLYMKYFA